MTGKVLGERKTRPAGASNEGAENAECRTMHIHCIPLPKGSKPKPITGFRPTAVNAFQREGAANL